ncbi:MAG: hypothetical protein HC831_12175 [Chloroflexia bacterium]|nr:hypothetical protein [Chloroflexia bacterium]
MKKMIEGIKFSKKPLLAIEKLIDENSDILPILKWQKILKTDILKCG